MSRAMEPRSFKAINIVMFEFILTKIVENAFFDKFFVFLSEYQYI